MKKIIAVWLGVFALLIQFPLYAKAEEATVESADGEIGEAEVEHDDGINQAKLMEFGETYSYVFTKSNEYLRHYSKFVLEEPGVITITATKPCNDRGYYQTVEYELYNAKEETIYGNLSSMAVNDEKEYYQIRMGLPAGRYYFSMKPYAWVSCNMETKYGITFEASDTCELEPNETKEEATPLTSGKMYRAFLGHDGYGFGNYGKHDYFKFNVVKGRTYRIKIGNYDIFRENNSTIDCFGKDYYKIILDEKDFWQIDEDGCAYADYTATKDEVFYLHVPSSGVAQFEYLIGYVDLEQEALEKIGEFVTRLYEVCLGRTPDEAGKTQWSTMLYNEEISGIDAAYGFIFSTEFKTKNLCNQDYVEQLYRAFMGRASDPQGKALWVDLLNNGMKREEVFIGFAGSDEFKTICQEYGIACGSAPAVPEFGTVPTGPCSICGEENGIAEFVKRMYSICLGREPELDGLEAWCSALHQHTETGRSVAYGFIFSDEFVNKKHSDVAYVEHLYRAFLGREADANGKEFWVGELKQGKTRLEIFDGFVGSQEFTDICAGYGILRD